MKTFFYSTDSVNGTIKATSIQAAFDEIRPTDDQIEDGAYGLVRDETTNEELDTRNGD